MPFTNIFRVAAAAVIVFLFVLLTSIINPNPFKEQEFTLSVSSTLFQLALMITHDAFKSVN